jgi:hypothetical protein
LEAGDVGGMPDAGDGAASGKTSYKELCWRLTSPKPRAILSSDQWIIKGDGGVRWSSLLHEW